ncbi:hypothetical protein [Nocardia rhizosphaerihabitans]|uniref:Prokaryotic phospholipase A2 n=1 Tax=Nocardia rhizosphaerihabitans TaxID=1691570 RepID=A0ABQ2K8M1_9NOCA|nr:hypothetical protein [Nocardia rhizosphaerihabitans]GGN71832.1 hypothetical protein GCM10011610_12510 [Nocardia rhizosphaerihabitans]
MNTPLRPVPAVRRARTAVSASASSNTGSPAEAAHRRRSGVALCTAGLAMAAAVVMSAPGAMGTTPGGGTENAAAAAVVRALTDDDPDATALIPRDFGYKFGYDPAQRDGLLVNPNGSCSSPVTLPAEFGPACMAHDLGYDMLRYAERVDEPLGAWARRSVDAALNRRIHAACELRDDEFSRARCGVMADIAFTAVDVNSRRQEYGAPVVENVFATTDPADRPNLWPLARTVLGLFAVTAASAVIIDALRKRRRRLA